MASKSIASLALFLALNLLFFSLVSACDTCPKPKPKPCPPPPSSNQGKCPRDALQLNVCASLLGGLVGISLPQKAKCCSLLDGLVDLDAAVCLCTAIKANVLGINLNIPLSLEVLLNVCDKNVPPRFTCA